MPGSPEHIPDEKTRAEVSALCAYGVPQHEIAVYIGVDPKTLRKHYRAELDTAKTKAHAAVGRFLYQAASGAALEKGATHADCIRAAMFWAKTQMGFVDRTAIEHTSPDGSMSPIVMLPSKSIHDPSGN